MKISKISLGTAQLGLNYGIANIRGKPTLNEGLELLKYAWNHGINTIDTAPAYGNSEKIIGSFITSHLKDINEKPIIISKIPKIDLKKGITSYDFIKKSVSTSLKNLNLKKISYLLLHHAPDISLENGMIIDHLNQIKDEGLIKNFGLSIYTQNDVAESLKYKEIQVIQIPLNIFDQKLIRSGILKILSNRNYTIFARSIYLQGLFFLSPEISLKKLKLAFEPLKQLNEISIQYKISIAKMAFIFIRDLPEISSLTVGTDNLNQIKSNLELLNEKPISLDLRKKIVDTFSNLPKELINPSLWNI